LASILEAEIETVTEDGKRVIIRQLVEVIVYETHSDPKTRKNGQRSWWLKNEMSVRRINDHTFEVFDTKERLRKI
jgi:hypothetical protein